jgi:hypothetical protein
MHSGREGAKHRWRWLGRWVRLPIAFALFSAFSNWRVTRRSVLTVCGGDRRGPLRARRTKRATEEANG